MADRVQPSLRDLACSGGHPGVKTPGCFQVSLRDNGDRPEQQTIIALVKNIT